MTNTHLNRVVSAVLKIITFLLYCFYVFITSDANAQNMKIGTNFWARVDWTGEIPYKTDVNFSVAWNSGITDYTVNQNIWNEKFLEEIDFYSVLRFMDWLPTNKSPIKNWSERRLPTDANQNALFGSEVGVAYEWMIDLCNRVDANIWLCIPHAATNDYCRNLAELIHTNLNPKLNIYIEYSNEVWNFEVQGEYAEVEGSKLGITKQQYVAYRSAQIWKIFKDVFEDEFEERVIKTICGQSSNSWIANEQLEYMYSTNNPAGLYPDVYGIAPYFGGNGLDANASNIWQLLDTDIFEHRWDRADKGSRMDGVRNNYNRIKSYDINLELIAYEGGQHIQKNATKVNYDEKMYELYKKYLEAIDDYISLFVHYVNAGECSDGNCWGAKEFTGQDITYAPKYRALFDYAGSSLTGNSYLVEQEPKLRVYPNPFNDELSIESETFDVYKISLFNLEGLQLSERILTNPAKQVKLSTKDISSGYYILEVTFNNKTLKTKLLKF
ncbi:T9SS type A sorting domain-containing protein [uncultured Draconibacterium sp.]|uniref:T9SS type A sorting domain-containing protein n=1 Tax=uncultured Draconibacterium sp. TaxID=1573823 RepID=UPI0029C8BE11|nr:T9SS type A sorting domain-containing protein [uncultured Draconibacterium sp.]